MVMLGMEDMEGKREERADGSILVGRAGRVRVGVLRVGLVEGSPVGVVCVRSVVGAVSGEGLIDGLRSGIWIDGTMLGRAAGRLCCSKELGKSLFINDKIAGGGVEGVLGSETDGPIFEIGIDGALVSRSGVKAEMGFDTGGRPIAGRLGCGTEAVTRLFIRDRIAAGGVV